MNRFEGKVVVITGGVGGLGTTQAHAFAAEGARLALNHLDGNPFADQAEEMCTLLREQYGGQYQHYAADVTNESEVTTMFEQVQRDFGRIDVLINNAGIMKHALVWKMPQDMWRTIIEINLTGSFLCTKAVLPYMREQNYGRIIYMCSVGGLSGVAANSAYAASKAGLVGLMKSTVREVSAKGITVNCVAPGFIAAGMMDKVTKEYMDNDLLPFIPMHKMGTDKNVADAVLFMASDQAEYITGETLRVDGGFSM